MSDHIYKKLELVGSSTQSSDQAVKNALAKAAESVRRLDWFEVVETRGQVVDGEIAYWQVVVKAGFRLE